MLDFFGPGYDASEMNILSGIEGLHYQIPRLAFLDVAVKEKLSLGCTTLRKNLFGGWHFNCYTPGRLRKCLASGCMESLRIWVFENHRRGTEDYPGTAKFSMVDRSGQGSQVTIISWVADSDRLSLEEAVEVEAFHQCSTSPLSHFLEDVGEVLLDGVLGDVEGL